MGAVPQHLSEYVVRVMERRRPVDGERAESERTRRDATPDADGRGGRLVPVRDREHARGDGGGGAEQQRPCREVPRLCLFCRAEVGRDIDLPVPPRR